MITLNEAQVWTIIGVLSAAVFGMITFGFNMMLRTMRAEIRAEVGGVTTEVRVGFAAVNARIDSLERRFDHLDRDVDLLMKHTFGIDRE